MSDRGVNRILAGLLLLNAVLVGLGFWWGQSGGATPTPTPSPTPSMAAVALPPRPMGPGIAVNVPLETIYWGLFRFQESPATALSSTQGAALRKALEQAAADGWPAERERTALMAILSEQQRGTLGMWQSRAQGMARAARDSLYATRHDALTLVSAPLQAAAGDTGPNGPDKPRLSVPYYELLWGLTEVDQRSGMPINAEQARFIGRVVDELLGVFARLERVYAEAVRVANRTLRPDQLAYVQAHAEAIETFSLKFMDVVPMDADVVGYVALRMMARRAGVGVTDVPPPALPPESSSPTGVVDSKNNPEYFFSGTLQLQEDPALALDARQSLALMPYVKAVADANYHSHVVKEQIGNTLTRKQRVWILDRLRQTAGKQRKYPTPGEVVREMKGRAAP